MAQACPLESERALLCFAFQQGFGPSGRLRPESIARLTLQGSERPGDFW